MAEFLVQIEISLPIDMDANAAARLTETEAARGHELIDEGTISRIWRVPGRTANIGLWSATDVTELHQHLASLPMFPHMDVKVTPLAVHPLEAS